MIKYIYVKFNKHLMIVNDSLKTDSVDSVINLYDFDVVCFEYTYFGNDKPSKLKYINMIAWFGFEFKKYNKKVCYVDKRIYSNIKDFLDYYFKSGYPHYQIGAKEKYLRFLNDLNVKFTTKEVVEKLIEAFGVTENTARAMTAPGNINGFIYKFLKQNYIKNIGRGIYERMEING